MISIRPPGRVGHVAGRVLQSLRSWQVWDLRGPLRCYVLAVPVVYAGALVFAASTTTWQPRHAFVFLALVACGMAVTEANRSVREPQGTLARDLQSVWYLAIAITLPPWYALAAPIPLAVHKLWRTRRMLIYRRIFSHAAIGLAYGLASVTFHAMPAAVVGASPGTGRHALSWVLAVTACGLIGTLVNYGFILVAIRLSDPDARVRDLMQAQLLAQARIDAKTGLLNAGTWQREAAAEFYRALRSDAPLALVMVDIDHFSSVNETAGLEAGDRVLQDIARTVTQNLQGSGLVGRFGGKQFAILLPQTGETEARRIAERLRDHIAGEPIAIEDGSHAGFVFRLTVSIGIGILDRSRRALAELIGAADKALTEAKATGRNKVCVVPGVIEPD